MRILPIELAVGFCVILLLIALFLYKKADNNGMAFLSIIIAVIFGFVTLLPYIGQNTITKLEFAEHDIRIYLGEGRQLLVNIEPHEAEDQNLAWESDKPDIVSVDGNGYISALETGSAIITVRGGNYSDSCKVTVNKSETENTVPSSPDKSFIIKPEKLYLPLGYQQYMFLVNYNPLLSYDDRYWDSDDNKIVSVDQNGCLSANSIGTTTIHCSFSDIIADSEVTVVDPTTYNAGVNPDDLKIQVYYEWLTDNKLKVVLSDIIPEGKTQTQSIIRIDMGNPNLINSFNDYSIMEGPSNFSCEHIFDINHQTDFYVEAEFIIDGQIIKTDKQRCD